VAVVEVVGFTINGGNGRSYCGNCPVQEGVCPACGLFWYVDPRLPGTGRAATDIRDLDPRVYLCPTCGHSIGCDDEWHSRHAKIVGWGPFTRLGES
jgi:hypothetical protein